MWGYRKLRLGIEGTCRNAILWRLGVNLREAGYRPCGFRRVPYWRRFARNYGRTNARFYSSDFGSDLFIGDLVLSRESNSCAQAGTPTLPSRMISFALTFLP